MEYNAHHIYSFKQEFLLDLLDSMPRLRLSDQQMKLVIFILKEAGVKNVPSLDTLRRVQKKLREDIAVPTERHISVKGNVFYVNQLCGQIAQVSLISNGSKSSIYSSNKTFKK